MTVVKVLAATGAVLLVPQVYRFANFIWLYLLRPSTVHKYLHSAPAYALVTGASDGIGKAVAQELYDRGFNLILHGRNEEKVRRVAEEIRARRPGDVRYFIADATAPDNNFDDMLAPFRGLHITVVIHNVGGSYSRYPRIDGFSDAELVRVVHWNAIFPLLLTRALLPQLRTTARGGPVMVQFVGSVAADTAPPRFALYAAAKTFLQALARGLDTDERVWGAPTGVRFAYLSVSAVRSASTLVKARGALDAPPPERFARALVGKIGCGWRRYAPWMPHAVMQWAVGLMGERTVDQYVAEAVREGLVAQKKLE
ncbi:hypothetical protein AcW1_003739 [Taiwanofungus camphoratus]|nr:hypothetical protein AcW1_003739 [Antrodia cinnamomea]